MGTDATLSIALIVAVFGAFSTLYNLSANRKKAIQTETSQMEDIRRACDKANMKLDTACGQLTSISTDVKAMQVQINKTETKIAVLERDLQTAFNQIGEVREQVEKAERHGQA